MLPPFPLANLDESEVWIRHVKPELIHLRANTLAIWVYTFQEMLNNSIDHSNGTQAIVGINHLESQTQITIQDDGEGVFRKIREALGLWDDRHASLELAKGKFTTDTTRHSGEGIFFTSRMCDRFSISSQGIRLTYQQTDNWQIDTVDQSPGTTVIMTIANETGRTPKSVYDRFVTDEDYGFTKTIVPVQVALYGDDLLVSRSQARRLLSRLEQFRVVVLDFAGVDQIGQAFAHEIFRVFSSQYSNVQITEINTNKQVAQMISRARDKR